MKMIHGNAVFIREEAKLAGNTHRYTFSMRNFTSFNFNFPEHKANYTAICSCDYDVMLGGVTHKSWYCTELNASRFLNN